MKKILCFGDSNTYGFIPGDGRRYDINSRWSGILKTKLSGKYNVIEAGCNNRTGFNLNSEGEERTGFLALPKYLTKDTDILILALGINDVQLFYSFDETKIEKGLERLVEIAKNINPNIKIIIAAPSCPDENVLKGFFSFQFNEESIEKSKKLAPIYKQIAKNQNLIFVNLNESVKVSPKDGLHYEEKEHSRIAEIMQKTVAELNLT